MATSSITKTFVVKDRQAYEKMKKELDATTTTRTVATSPSLEKGRKKLATFVFR